MVKELVDKPDNEVKKVLDAAMLKYFHRDNCKALWDMVDSWNLYPAWRRRIFEEAFWAHRYGKYALSVSALAPQIEGVLRDETHEYESNARYLLRINEILDFTYDRKTPPVPPSVRDLERAVEELSDLDPPTACCDEDGPHGIMGR